MSELKTFQGPQNQVLPLRARFGATLAGKGGLFQGFSRAFPGRWLSGAGTACARQLKQQHRGDARVAGGTAHERHGSAQSRRCPSPARGPGCHCSATGAAAPVVRLAQPLLSHARGHTPPHSHGLVLWQKNSGARPRDPLVALARPH